MEKMKRFPKLATASLALLGVALILLWMDWLQMDLQASIVSSLLSLSELNSGGLSFVEGLTLIGKLTSTLDSFGVSSEFLSLLYIIYLACFIGTLLSVFYCVYARVKWHQGLKEGIYLIVFLADLALYYVFMSQLNEVFGSNHFSISVWALAAVFCALLSEIFWEEASFNTPNPMLAPEKAASAVQE